MSAYGPLQNDKRLEQLLCEHDFATTFALEIRCTICGLVKEGPKP